MIEDERQKTNTQRVMTTTQKIVDSFVSKIDLEKEYSKIEFAKVLSEAFKEIHDGVKDEKKVRKTKRAKMEEGGEEKKKREPTAYNLFVKETMGVVKEENPEMTRQDLMKEIGKMWREKKQ